MDADAVPPLALFVVRAHLSRARLLIFQRASAAEVQALLARTTNPYQARTFIAVRPRYYLEGSRLKRIPRATVRFGILKNTPVLLYEAPP